MGYISIFNNGNNRFLGSNLKRVSISSDSELTVSHGNIVHMITPFRLAVAIIGFMEVPPLTLELSPSSSAVVLLPMKRHICGTRSFRMWLHTLSGVRCRQIAISYGNGLSDALLGLDILIQRDLKACTIIDSLNNWRLSFHLVLAYTRTSVAWPKVDLLCQVQTQSFPLLAISLHAPTAVYTILNGNWCKVSARDPIDLCSHLAWCQTTGTWTQFCLCRNKILWPHGQVLVSDYMSRSHPWMAFLFIIPRFIYLPCASVYWYHCHLALSCTWIAYLFQAML